MTDLTSFNKTNNVTDHLAAHVNDLIAASLRAEYKNTETLSATRQLTDSDCPIQILTMSGANRDVKLPVEATTNHPHLILNNGGSLNAVIKDDSGATTFATLEPGEWCLALPFGGVLWKVIDSNALTSSLPASDASAIIKGSSDATKQLRFEVDGFTTGTTRVLTPPNFDATIATLAGTETLTNKTLTTPTIADHTNAQHNHSNAAGGGSVTVAGLPVAVLKTADETVNNSNVLQNDDHLFFSVAANKNYKFELWLLLNPAAGSATDDIKLHFTGPAGCTMFWGTLQTTNAADDGISPAGTGGTVVANQGISGTPAYGTGAFNFALKLEGIILNGANAGTIQLQWAQSAAGAHNLVLQTGSALIYTLLN
jgi:hypothetical protein